MSESEPPNSEPDRSLTTLRERLTDLQAQLAAAERREGQLRQIIDLVPDLIFSSDAEGRYLLANKALADAYGIGVDEVCQRRKQDLTPDPELGKRLVEEDLAVLRSGEPSFVPELEVKDANGNRHTFQHRRIPYISADTGAPAVLGVATNISERKLAEAEAESARARLEDAIEAIGDGFLLFDADERLVMANSRVTTWAEQLAGQFEYGEPIETIFRRWADQWHFASSSDVDVADREAMVRRRLAYHRNAPSTQEQRFVDDRWVLVSTRPTSDGGRIVAYTDITEQKAAERVRREKTYQDRELGIAHDIQLSLLPESKPRVPGFDVAGWNQAADETGGDYFDWHTLADGRTALAIGDVTGHGLGPAMIVATCRAYLRASMVSERSIEAVLDRVNELLSSDLTGGRFVTAAVGIIDPTASRMQLFSAGQAPMFFFEAARDRVQVWGADHFPLGIVPAYAAGRPREIEFGLGDTLVLVTDGFLEWPDRYGEHFDEQRVAATIRELRGHSAEELIKGLYERVFEFSGGMPQRDDLTALVIKRDE